MQAFPVPCNIHPTRPQHLKSSRWRANLHRRFFENNSLEQPKRHSAAVAQTRKACQHKVDSLARRFEQDAAVVARTERRLQRRQNDCFREIIVQSSAMVLQARVRLWLARRRREQLILQRSFQCIEKNAKGFISYIRFKLMVLRLQSMVRVWLAVRTRLFLTYKVIVALAVQKRWRAIKARAYCRFLKFTKSETIGLVLTFVSQASFTALASLLFQEQCARSIQRAFRKHFAEVVELRNQPTQAKVSGGIRLRDNRRYQAYHQGSKDNLRKNRSGMNSRGKLTLQLQSSKRSLKRDGSLTFESGGRPSLRRRPSSSSVRQMASHNSRGSLRLNRLVRGSRSDLRVDAPAFSPRGSLRLDGPVSLPRGSLRLDGPASSPRGSLSRRADAVSAGWPTGRFSKRDSETLVSALEGLMQTRD